MAHLFISYCSQDRQFALQLSSELEKFYDVWIDRTEIKGGLIWEKEIDQALKACSVFLVIVSSLSNESEWVARETLRAEQLQKYRIPILIEGELPLRLLDVHYIDFRGDYDGGVRDLLEILKQHIEPQDRSGEEVYLLIGTAVSAYLSEDYAEAYNIIGQALVLNPKIAESPQDFWKKLRRLMTTDIASQLMSKIKIYESTSPNHEYYSDGSPVFIWSIELDVQASILDQIDYVQYELHPSFVPSIQISRDRSTRFKITRKGWGTFEIPIEIHFVDGTVGYTSYHLTF